MTHREPSTSIRARSFHRRQQELLTRVPVLGFAGAVGVGAREPASASFELSEAAAVAWQQIGAGAGVARDLVTAGVACLAMARWAEFSPVAVSIGGVGSDGGVVGVAIEVDPQHTVRAHLRSLQRAVDDAIRAGWRATLDPARAIHVGPCTPDTARFVRIEWDDAPAPAMCGRVYGGSLLDAAEVAELAARIARMAETLAPLDRPLAAVSMVARAEQERLAEVPAQVAGASVHAEFAATAAAHPAHPAVVEGARTTTYAELLAVARRLAAHLHAACSVRPGDRIALALPRGTDAIIGMIAALELGAVYVPLDLTQPEDRLVALARAVDPKIVLVHADRMLAFADVAAPFVMDAQLAALADGAPPARSASRDDAAYIMFTSGSTGGPKAVEIPHRGILRLVAGLPDLALDGAVVLHAAPIAFDAATFEIWGALLRGGTVVVSDPTPAALERAIADHGVTVAWLTSGLFNVIARERPVALRPLRQLLVGGEALSPAHVHAALDAAPGLELFNGYGPTECTTFACVHRVERDAPRELPIPIGRAIGFTSCAVVSADLALVPDGVAGELCISGDGLALGYVGDAEQTAAAFVRSAALPDRIWYRTGDRVRRDDAGRLHFLGRRDDQVKVRGFRFHLGEVEAALAALPDVERAVAVASSHDGRQRVVAYVCLRRGRSGREVLAQLAPTVPAYMVPAAIHVVREVSLTANGKCDVARLDGLVVVDDAPRAHPTTATEDVVLGVWRSILGRDDLGVEDNFFAVGGDSLIAIQIVARLEQLGLAVAIEDVFDHVSVRALAAAADARAASATGAVTSTDAPAPAFAPGVKDEFPLGALQRGLVFDAEAAGDGTYHDVIGYELEAPYDQDALVACVGALVQRHPALRTAIDVERGVNVVYARARRVALEASDLRGIAAEDQRAALDRWTHDEAHRGFRLDVAPLWRFHVHRLDERRFHLSLSIHHAMVDGWSIATLWTELLGDYDRALAGVQPDGTSGAVPCAMHRAVDAERAAREAGTSREFWRRHLDGCAPWRLPAWPKRGGAVHRVDTTLDARIVTASRAIADAAGVPLKSVLLAIHAGVLADLAGRADVVTGVVANIRPAGAHGDVGLFLNTLAFRLDGRAPLAAAARSAFELERAALPHRFAPLSELKAACGGTLPFEALFNYVDFHVYGRLDALERVAVRRQTSFERSSMPLGATFALVRDPAGDRLAINLEVGAAVGRQQAQDVLDRYVAALERLTSRPDASPAPRESVWCTPASGDPDQTALERIDAVAARYPDAVAIEADGRSWTYRALGEAASALSARLDAAGVAAGSVVALEARFATIDAIALILAVWRRGAAYVPFDPAEPEARRGALQAACGASHRARWTTAGLDLAALDTTTPRRACACAYVIFTSGSTGVPKGVAVGHAGLPNLITAQGRAFGVQVGTRVLQFAPLTFDASVSELFVTLGNGGTLVLPARDVALVGAELCDALTRARAALVTLPPSVIATIPVGAQLPELRTLVTAGEVCPPALATRWANVVRLINAYGPTEGTVCSTLSVVASGDEPTVGPPIAGTEVRVLDEHMQPVALGTEGELYIGGVHLALGYVDAAATAARFVPHPAQPGARLYRTGDRARLLPDGHVHVVGRLDRQIKHRGVRIEPGEVEAVMASVPGVAAAAVLLQPVTGESALLVGHYAPATIDASAMRAALAMRLPAHLVPQRLIAHAALPVSRHGKVDLDALRATTVAAAVPVADAIAADPVRRAIVALWQELLGVPVASVDASFFELGGDSLLATRMVAGLQARTGRHVSLRAFLAEPTIAGLAGVLADADAATPGLPAAPPARPPMLALTEAQRRIWMVQKLGDARGAYNMPIAWRLRGALDVARLRDALDRVWQRHEGLRACLVDDGARGHQLVTACAALPLQLHTVVDAADPEAAARRWLSAEIARPLDPTRAPVARLSLVHVGDDDHVLVAVFHHVLFDGWSVGLFGRELARAYAGGATDVASAWQWGDAAAWQQTQSVAASDRIAWIETLAQHALPLELPVDRPWPAAVSHAGAVHHFELPAAVADRVRAFAGEARATPFAVLLALVQIVLAERCRQRAFVLGVPVAGRPDPVLESVIGLLANVVPVPALVEPRASLREVLELAGRRLDQAMQLQAVPLDAILDAIPDARVPGRAPLFQAAVVYQNATGPDESWPGLEVDGFALDWAFAKYDVTFAFADGDGGMRGTLEYRTDVLDEASATAMVRHFVGAAEALLAAPDRPLAEVATVDPAASARAIDAGRRRTAWPVGATLVDRFRAIAARHPDRLALRHAGADTTYRALDDESDRMAAALRRRGVGPGHAVGLYVRRGPAWVVASLGVLKAGAAYVPIDPAYPADRVAFILRDAGARVVVVDDAPPSELPAGVTCVAADVLVAEAPRERVPHSPVTGDAAAYMIYTSGSTGRPKGVVVSHHNVVRLLAAADEDMELSERDVWTLFHSYAFDFSVWEMFGALCSGGCVVVVPEDAVRDPERLARLLVDEGVTVLSQTPSAFRQLARADEASSRAYALRYVVFGGERLTVGELAGWVARHGATPALINMYGITETTVHTTFCHVTTEAVFAAAIESPIGRGLADLDVFVLDAQLRPAPAGVPGEIYVGGDGVARGYHGRPGLTAERFVPNPYGRPGERLYRSGDLARLLPDGQLAFIGRADQQVKVRGFRIELGEIEHCIASHPGVRECRAAVLTHGDTPRLAAYVVASAPSSDAIVDEASLRAWAGSRLPDYMVPSRVVFVSAIPLTAHGKLDLSELRAAPAPARQDDGDADGDGALVALRAIWRDLLERDELDTTAHFFKLGGDSILALHMVTRARDAGWELSAQDVFARPVLGELAASARPRAHAVPTARVAGTAPLSPIQHWFFEAPPPVVDHWHQAIALRVAGALDIPRFQGAVDALVERHDAFRLRFEPGDGAWVQRYADDATVRVVALDLSAEPASAAAGAFAAAADQLYRAIELSRGPVFGAIAARMPDGDTAIVLAAHHLVIDAVSWGIVVDDLDALYAGVARDRTRSASYQEWTRALCAETASPTSAAELAYWREVVRGGAAGLAADHPAEPNEVADRVAVAMCLDAAETSRLFAHVDGDGSRVPVALLGAVVAGLKDWRGLTHVCVDVEGHGRDVRDDIDVARTVGWFTCLYPVRIDVTRAPNVAAICQRVEHALASVPRRGVGYGVLRYLHADPVVRASLVSASPVSFNYVGRFDAAVGRGAFALDGEPPGQVGDPRAIRRHELDVTASVEDGRLHLAIAYAGRRFERSSIVALVAHVERNLRVALAADVGAFRAPGSRDRRGAQRPLVSLSAADLATLARETGTEG